MMSIIKLDRWQWRLIMIWSPALSDVPHPCFAPHQCDAHNVDERVKGPTENYEAGEYHHFKQCQWNRMIMIQVKIVIIITVNNDLHRHQNPNYHRQPVSQNLSRVVTLRRFLLIHLSTVLNWQLSSWRSFEFHEGCHLEPSLLCNCHTVGGSISLCVQYCRIISDAVFVHVPKLLKTIFHNKNGYWANLHKNLEFKNFTCLTLAPKL